MSLEEPDKKTKDQIQDDRLNDHWNKIETLEKKVESLIVDYKTLEIPDCNKKKMTLCFEDRLVAKKLGYLLVKRELIEGIVKKLEIAHNKLNNVIIERELSYYLIKLIEEYKRELK